MVMTIELTQKHSIFQHPSEEKVKKTEKSTKPRFKMLKA